MVTGTSAPCLSRGRACRSAGREWCDRRHTTSRLDRLRHRGVGRHAPHEEELVRAQPEQVDHVGIEPGEALRLARVAVGLGISRPEHIREIGRYADGAIVGTAIYEGTVPVRDAVEVLRCAPPE